MKKASTKKSGLKSGKQLKKVAPLVTIPVTPKNPTHA